MSKIQQEISILDNENIDTDSNNVKNNNKNNNTKSTSKTYNFGATNMNFTKTQKEGKSQLTTTQVPINSQDLEEFHPPNRYH